MKRHVPKFYVCSKCSVTNVKLWRIYGTSHVEPLCTLCMCQDQHIDITTIADDGTRNSPPLLPGFPSGGRTDQMGDYIPAVPDHDGNWWGYSTALLEDYEWWKLLPLQGGTMPAHYSKRFIHDFFAEYGGSELEVTSWTAEEAQKRFGEEAGPYELVFFIPEEEVESFLNEAETGEPVEPLILLVFCRVPTHSVEWLYELEYIDISMQGEWQDFLDQEQRKNEKPFELPS